MASRLRNTPLFIIALVLFLLGMALSYFYNPWEVPIFAEKAAEDPFLIKIYTNVAWYNAWNYIEIEMFAWHGENALPLRIYVLWIGILLGLYKMIFDKFFKPETMREASIEKTFTLFLMDNGICAFLFPVMFFLAPKLHQLIESHKSDWLLILIGIIFVLLGGVAETAYALGQIYLPLLCFKHLISPYLLPFIEAHPVPGALLMLLVALVVAFLTEEICLCTRKMVFILSTGLILAIPIIGELMDDYYEDLYDDDSCMLEEFLSNL